MLIGARSCCSHAGLARGRRYESLGWWRRSAEMKRVHFAEEWNEFHHLLIMESLGGDQRWVDRFFAHHAAIAYYWILVALWLLSPSLSYNFR